MWPAIVWYEMTGCTVTVAEKNKQSLGETTETTGALRALHGFFPVSKPLQEGQMIWELNPSDWQQERSSLPIQEPEIVLQWITLW